MRIRALLVAYLLTALSLIALPANAASAIQFRKIQYDPSGSDVRTNYQLNREYVTITNTGTTTRTLTAGRSVISRTTSTPFPASS